MAFLELRLLGGLTIEQDESPLTEVKSQKGMALFCYLAVSQKQRTRSFLAALFWPDMSESRALANLRKVLSRLKPLTPYLILTQNTMAFNRNADCWVDVTAFEKETLALNNVGGVVTFNTSHLKKAVSLYQGDFLAGFVLRDAPLFEEWVLAQRARLRELALTALHQLVTHFREKGEYETAIAYARQILNIEPWHEETHRELMRLLAHAGQRTAAITQYKICRQLLDDELKIAPTTATIQLYEQIKAGRLNKKVEKRIWGEMPGSRFFYGREAELAQLERWLLAERSKLVIILGMGGQGKTAIAIRLTQAIAAISKNNADQRNKSFDFIIWQSLINAPSLDTVLQTITQIIAEQPFSQSPTSTKQWEQLFTPFRQKRCLIILDNVETILQDDTSVGQFRPGFAAYGDLIEKFARQDHQSCLLLTSRERPKILQTLERNHDSVHALMLSGLSSTAGQRLLADRHISSSMEKADKLVQKYSGNPLALHLIAETIQEFFAGNINSFLMERFPIFADIRDVLDQQFERLSILEKDILFWLAIERWPVTPETLWSNLINGVSKRALLEALRTLHCRSLLEEVGANGVTLQNVVLEYVTDKLVETAVNEFNQLRPSHQKPAPLKLLHSHALCKAQSRDYIRESQKRLILKPLLQQLIVNFGTVGVQKLMQSVLEELRQAQRPSYAAGNLINLLVELGVDMHGRDFSQLTIWQAYLQDINLSHVNFSEADLTGSVLSDAFGAIVSLAVSPDGTLIAGGTEVGEVCLWRIADGQLVNSFQAHTASVWSVAFAPDNKTFATCSGDKTIRIWGCATTQLHLTLLGHTNAIWTVVFSPDGQNLISGSSDCTVRVWDITTAQPKLTLTGQAKANNVAISANGRLIASSGGDKKIRLWDVNTGELCQVLQGHTKRVGPILFTPDSNLLASSSYDRTVRLWDVTTGELLHTFYGHTAIVTTLAMSADGKILASGGGDQTIHLWDVGMKQKRQVLVGHTNLVDSLAFTPDNNTLISGSYDQTVRLWDIETGRPLHKLSGYNMCLTSIAISQNGYLLASGGYDQKVRLWDLETGLVLRHLVGHTNWIWSVVFSPDGTLIASASYDNTACLWDMDTGQLRYRLRGHKTRVTTVAFSPDGLTLLTGSLDRTIRQWDVMVGNLLQEPIRCSYLIWSIDVEASGQLIACGGYDPAITVWNRDSGELVKRLHGHTDFVRAVAFSPNGRLLASGGFDDTVRVWNVKLGKTIHTLETHTAWVECVAFGPNNRFLASGSRDQTIHLWDIETYQLLHVLRGHTKMVLSIAFNPDGTLLASSSGDETIKLWDVQTGVCLNTLQAKLPYDNMNITDVRGLTPSQKSALKALGAVENDHVSISTQ